MTTAQGDLAALLPCWHVQAQRGVGAGASPGVPVWRADAPALRGGPATGRGTAAERIRQMQIALDEAEMQLGEVIAQAGAAGVARGGPERAVEWSDAQSELMGVLIVARARDVTATRGLFDDLAPHVREFREWLETVRSLFSPQVAIETPAGDSAVNTADAVAAKTFVSWLGDFASAYGAPVSPDLARRHCADVALAVADRGHALRSVALVVGGATRIAVLLATPGASWMLIAGAVWRFVRRFLVG